MKSVGVGADSVWLFYNAKFSRSIGVILNAGSLSPQDRPLHLFLFCPLFEFLKFALYE
jgi:hypothetical protein